MPRKITIKSLEQAMKLSGNQLTAEALLNGQIYIKDRGWTSVQITDELRRKIADEVSELLGGFARTRHDVYMRLRRVPAPQHWGLRRMLVIKYGKDPARISYCAGQDYTAECRDIRTYLKNA